MKKIVLICFIASLFSCQDDDVCVDGTTPNLIVVFKDQLTSENLTLDSIYVEYKLNEAELDTLKLANTDSISIPLRIDNGAIDFKLFRSLANPNSEIQMTYTTEDVYVSKGCGFKKIFKSVDFQLTTAEDIQSILTNKTEIIDESETHLFIYY